MSNKIKNILVLFMGFVSLALVIFGLINKNYSKPPPLILQNGKSSANDPAKSATPEPSSDQKK